jgi:hypothetical protein
MKKILALLLAAASPLFSATLMWDRNPEPEVVGYKTYYDSNTIGTFWQLQYNGNNYFPIPEGVAVSQKVKGINSKILSVTEIELITVDNAPGSMQLILSTEPNGAGYVFGASGVTFVAGYNWYLWRGFSFTNTFILPNIDFWMSLRMVGTSNVIYSAAQDVYLPGEGYNLMVNNVEVADDLVFRISTLDRTYANSVDVGDTNAWRLSNIITNIPYRYAVTAYVTNELGMKIESDFSEELIYTLTTNSVGMPTKPKLPRLRIIP